MIVLLSLMACVFLVIAKALQVHRDLGIRQYSWRSAVLIASAWGFTFLPSLHAACIGLGCHWSLRLGWLAWHVGEVPFMNRLTADTVLTITMLLVWLVTILFLGHVLGWLLYGTQRLLRRVA